MGDLDLDRDGRVVLSEIVAFFVKHGYSSELAESVFERLRPRVWNSGPSSKIEYGVDFDDFVSYMTPIVHGTKHSAYKQITGVGEGVGGANSLGFAKRNQEEDDVDVDVLYSLGY